MKKKQVIDEVTKIVRDVISEVSIPDNDVFKLERIGQEAFDKIDELHKQLNGYKRDVMSDDPQLDSLLDKIYDIRNKWWKLIKNDLDSLSDRHTGDDFE